LRQVRGKEVIFRNIKYGIKNLTKWFSVIWNDRDWDHHFLFEILKFKLEQMEDLQEILKFKLEQMEDLQRKHGIKLYRDKYADQMRVCINLLNRIIEDEYYENTFKHHDKKWGEADLVFKPLPDDEELGLMEIEREKVTTDKEKAQERKEWKRLHEHSEKLREQDLDMLFLNMRKYIQGWWD
jgi:hypothetical protein